MAPGVSRQKNNYFYRAGSVGLLSAYYRPPLVEVQSVLWLRPRTGDRVALLWEDKPSAVPNNAHSRCRLSIAQASLALRSAQAFFDRLLQDERRNTGVSLVNSDGIAIFVI